MADGIDAGDDEVGVDDGASTVSMTPSAADAFHKNSNWATDPGKFQFYMVFVVSERTGLPAKCDLCSCLSSDPSPLPGSHPRDKHGGCVPWNRYKAVPKKMCRRVRSKLCLVCVLVFKECRLEIYVSPPPRAVLLSGCVCVCVCVCLCARAVMVLLTQVGRIVFSRFVFELNTRANDFCLTKIKINSGPNLFVLKYFQI